MDSRELFVSAKYCDFSTHFKKKFFRIGAILCAEGIEI
jgi:hypothetical protein